MLEVRAFPFLWLSSIIITAMKLSSVLAGFALLAQATAATIGKSLVVERGTGKLQDIVGILL